MKTNEAKKIVASHVECSGQEVSEAIRCLQFDKASVYEPRGLSYTKIPIQTLTEIYLAHQDLDRNLKDDIVSFTTVE